MENDACVSQNYQMLISNTLSGVYDKKNNEISVEELRNRLVGVIQNSIHNVFDDLELTSIGDNPLDNGSFYFTKGTTKNFHYKNLSAGEKSALDILLDLIIKSTYFTDTVFCIDEPETHMHTSLQSRLLAEMYKLIPNNSQLWLATHSIGMLKEAELLNEHNQKSVAFIDFSNRDFDSKVEMFPSSNVDKTMWNRFMELAFGDFSKLVAPERIVFCEGDPNGKANKNFDASVYNKIFADKYSRTLFVSVGSCNEIEDPNNVSMKIISQIYKSKVVKLVDRDDKSTEEIQESTSKKINVLSRRHIESYLLDDEIITELCQKCDKTDKVNECIKAKQDALDDSIKNRHHPVDDVKSASGAIVNSLKKILEFIGVR